MAAKSTFLARAALVVLMAIGSVALWIAVPVFWLWLASQLQESSEPSLGPYLLVIVGIVVSVVAIAKGLAAADRAYGRLTGGDVSRQRVPWSRSMRGERDVDSGQPTTVLSTVMVVSVGLCLFCFVLWFFLLAGSSLPT